MEYLDKAWCHAASMSPPNSHLDEPGQAHGGRLRLLLLSSVNLRELCHGTGLRLSHLVRHLERSHCITLLCADEFPHPGVVRQPWIRRSLSLLDFRQPYPFQPEFQQAVQHALASDRFDAVVVFGADLLQYVEKCQIPIIADLVDEPILATLRALPAQSGLEYLRSIKQSLSLISYQRRFCRHVAACLVVSAEDAHSFSRLLPGVKVVVVPNGVDTGFFRPTGLPLEPSRIVFSGHMSFPPNVAGALYFARRVFPKVLAEFPQARWTIVGRDPHPSVAALGKLAGITVTGFVPDLRPFIEQAAVVISPLISGGGIKNKILEAWALGKGIVATPLGCAGIEVCDGVDLLIAKDARSFAEKTLHLLRDPAAAQSLGQAGLRKVAQKYAWEDKGAKLEQVVQSAVARGRKTLVSHGS